MKLTMTDPIRASIVLLVGIILGLVWIIIDLLWI